ncbi:MAG TPA: hypothetical protein VEL28_02065 [Candidatus Binatia bacterium]|nr:hypothetical protein [Candidatus Binatia bacterium]
MVAGTGSAAVWLVRLLVTVTAALVTGKAALSVPTALGTKTPTVHADASRSFHSIFWLAAASQAPIHLAYFTDSLAVSMQADRSTPQRLVRSLDAELKARGLCGTRAVKLSQLFYKRLSIWSYYFLHDRAARSEPHVAVLEFNLYNFSASWHRSAANEATAFLPFDHLRNVLALPVETAGFTFDTWLLHRLFDHYGMLDVRRSLQRSQALMTESYWLAGDLMQEMFSGSPLSLRTVHLAHAKAHDDSAFARRSSAKFSRTLFGTALTGVDEKSPPLLVLRAILERFRDDGIITLVYVPPYNVEHLNSIGILPNRHFEHAIELTREVVEECGARFADLHAIFGDQYFLDSQDHLTDEPNDGHAELARRLTELLVDDVTAIAERMRPSLWPLPATSDRRIR